MRKKKSIGERIFDAVILLILTVFSLCIILPFMNLISISMSDEFAIMGGRVGIFPVGFSFASYKKIFETSSILIAYRNTIIVACVGCVFSLLLTSFAAYPLAFGEFWGKKGFNVLVMLTMWFSGGMIPSFLVMSKLQLVDTLASLILASLITAYNVLILRTFFSSIPKELIESARVDGANDFCILFRIVIPLAKAGLATIALWVFVGHWNDYMNPLLYLRNVNKYTLQLVLREMVLTSESSSLMELMEGNRTALPEQLKHAVIVVAMIPVLAIYPFAQKYFVNGIMLGSVKG